MITPIFYDFVNTVIYIQAEFSYAIEPELVTTINVM